MGYRRGEGPSDEIGRVNSVRAKGLGKGSIRCQWRRKGRCKRLTPKPVTRMWMLMDSSGRVVWEPIIESESESNTPGADQ